MADDGELVEKLESIERRRKWNREAVIVWLACSTTSFIITIAVGIYLPNFLYGALPLLVIFGAMISFAFVLARLKTITVEESALRHAAKALASLNRYKSPANQDERRIAMKELRKAASSFNPKIITSNYQSSFIEEANIAINELTNILSKKLPYLLGKKDAQVDIAKQSLQDIVSVLTNPILENAKKYAKDAEALPEEPLPPPRAPIRWNQLTERRLVQLAISALSAVTLPPLISYFYASMLGLSVIQFMRDNPAILIGGAIAIFVGFLTWLKGK